MSEIQKVLNLIRRGGVEFLKKFWNSKMSELSEGGGVKPNWEFVPNFSAFLQWRLPLGIKFTVLKVLINDLAFVIIYSSNKSIKFKLETFYSVFDISIIASAQSSKTSLTKVNQYTLAHLIQRYIMGIRYPLM